MASSSSSPQVSTVRPARPGQDPPLLGLCLWLGAPGPFTWLGVPGPVIPFPAQGYLREWKSIHLIPLSRVRWDTRHGQCRIPVQCQRDRGDISGHAVASAGLSTYWAHVPGRGVCLGVENLMFPSGPHFVHLSPSASVSRSSEKCLC